LFGPPLANVRGVAGPGAPSARSRCGYRRAFRAEAGSRDLHAATHKCLASGCSRTRRFALISRMRRLAVTAADGD
jgi:hypothetical protein